MKLYPIGKSRNPRFHRQWVRKLCQKNSKNYLSTFGQSRVNEEFIEETLRATARNANCVILVDHLDHEKMKTFAVLRRAKRVLHVEFVASLNRHGKQCIQGILSWGYRQGCDYLRVSSLHSVVPFYRRCGFSFLRNPTLLHRKTREACASLLAYVQHRDEVPMSRTTTPSVNCANPRPPWFDALGDQLQVVSKADILKKVAFQVFQGK